MFLNLLTWINGSAPVYWTTCALALAALLFSIARAGLRHASTEPGPFPVDTRHSRIANWGFAGLMALTVLVFRWPILFVLAELNVDESQMGSQAMKYLLDFVPWRSVDGTTSGPLNSWLLVIPALFGYEISYLSGRIMGLLCVFATLGFTVATFRSLTSEFYARAAVLPMVLFYAFTTEINFTHYTSEHVPILLMAGAVFLGVAALSGDVIRSQPLFLSAVLFGALPWAKFQAAPVGFFGVLALMAAVVLKRAEWRDRLRPVALCAAGGLLVAVVIMAIVVAGGAFADFTISYLGLVKHHENFMMPLNEIIPFLTAGPQSFVYLASGVVFSTGALITLRMRGKKKLFAVRRPLFWFAGYLIACVFIVFKAGKSYPHYALFLIHPLGLFCGALLFALEDRSGRPATASRAESVKPRPRCALSRMMPALIFAGLFLVAQTGRKVVAAFAYPFTGIVKIYRDPPVDPVAELIRLHSIRGEQMVIWGWSPGYYMQTGLIQGTRDAIAQMAMFDDYPNHAFYQRRFLEDMKESEPRVFLDTDAPYFPPYMRQERHGHEKFPELAEYVQANYQLAYELAVPNFEEKIRIYLRKDPSEREGAGASSLQ